MQLCTLLRFMVAFECQRTGMSDSKTARSQASHQSGDWGQVSVCVCWCLEQNAGIHSISRKLSDSFLFSSVQWVQPNVTVITRCQVSSVCLCLSSFWNVFNKSFSQISNAKTKMLQLLFILEVHFNICYGATVYCPIFLIHFHNQSST